MAGLTMKATIFAAALAGGVVMATSIIVPEPKPEKVEAGQPTEETKPGVVHCANLNYGAPERKTSKCFSDKFLKDLQAQTNVWTSGKFTAVNLEDETLYRYPFAIMTGEGSFTLSEAQRRNLSHYLSHGGFLVASAGCSSEPWSKSFRQEIKKVFPKVELKRIPMEHPIFHTVYDLKQLESTRRSYTPYLEGVEINGRIVAVFSSDGLNDTGNAGGNCCCCGGNEIRNARQVNVNLLAYALTH